MVKPNGAPLGNKNAVGHGRPPNPGFSDPELIQLGEDLLNWIKEEDEKKSDIVHLSEFYSEIKEIPYSQWASICQRPCFLRYYERARDWMGKRILKNKELPTAYGSRFLGIYFKDINQHEREQAEHKIDYELAKKQEIAQKQISYPNDEQNEIKLAWVKSQGIIEEKDIRIKELESKLNEFIAKANPVNQPSNSSL